MSEVALDNYTWAEVKDIGRELTQEMVHWRSRYITNNVEFVRCAREVKNCDWDWKTSNDAAERGNLEIINYCVEIGVPTDIDSSARVRSLPETVHLNVLRYLHENYRPSEFERFSFGARKRPNRLPELFIQARSACGLEAFRAFISSARTTCLQHRL